MNSRRYGPIGLDVGARHVKAAQLRLEGDGTWTIDALATIPRTTPDVDAIDAAEVRRIGDVLFRRGFRGGELVLAVPDDRLMTANLELPPRNPDVPLDQIARSEFARTSKLDSDEFEFAYWDLPAPARASRATHVMAVGCRHADAGPLLDAFADAAGGFEVAALEVSACALARGCAAWIASAEEITAVVDIGWRAARLFVTHRGVVCYQRALVGYGVQRLHRALADQLGVGVEKQELIEHVVRHVSVDPEPASNSPADASAPTGAGADEARRAIRVHLDTVLAEVVTSLSYSSHQYPDAGARRVLLCGGGANCIGAGKYLSAKHKLDVRAVRPGDIAGLSPALERVVAGMDTSMILALGLARYEMREGKARVAA